MATQTLALADAILKDLYVGPIIEQLNQKTFLLDRIQRDADHVDHTGRRAIVPVHSNRNRGRGSRADAGVLPTAGRQDWQDAIIPLTRHFHGIELSDASIEATKNDAGAFTRLLGAESKGVATDMKKDMNRQAFGQYVTSGATGMLTLCVSASAGNVTVDSAQYIGVGDTVDVLVEATGATTAGIVGSTVTAVTGGAFGSNVITLSPAVTTPGSINNTYAVYITGNRTLESEGLRTIVNSSRTLHSINSATAGNQFWDSQVQNVGTSGTATALVVEDHFMKLADDVGKQGNGDVEVFITSRGIKRRLANQYQSQKRFNDSQAVDVHGGYTAIMVNEIPVVADDDAPVQEVFGLNLESFRWFQQTGPGWMESPSTGQVFQLKPQTVGASATYNAVWMAWFKWYATMGNIAPNRNGRLKFCTDDNPR